MVKLDLPTRKGVPQWVGVLIMFIVLLPITMLNGTYTGSVIEVSGTLGILSEDIMMAYYASAVGMAVAYPIVPMVRKAMTSKTLLLVDLMLQIILSIACANTDDIDIVVILSFFIGFLKAFVMFEFMMHIRPLFSPRNVRSEFYSYFYPIVFSGGQISMMITAQLAYYYQWQYMYYFMVLLMLIAMLLILVFFRYAKTPDSFPFRDTDWRSMILAAAALLFGIYVFTYGKTLNWFSSSKIVVYSLAAPLLVYLFMHRQGTAKVPYVSLSPLKQIKPVVGYFFMFIVMFITGTSTLVTNYMNSIIRVDSVHANAINLFMIPGFIIGAIVCFWWFRWQRWRFRYLISGGFFCFCIYLGILYFGMTPYSTYEMLFVPMFFRGLGMLTLFIAFGVYVVEDLELKVMLSNAFFLITFRSVIAPVVSSSFFNNALYHLQTKNMNTLSENLTMTTPIASDSYMKPFGQAIGQGYSYGDAGQIATNAMNTILQQQALLLSLKTIIGYALIGTLIIAVVCCFIPFHKTVKVAVVKTGDDMV